MDDTTDVRPGAGDQVVATGLGECPAGQVDMRPPQ
jgi:hypothetical protein